jgi:ClpP class serine protease
MWLLHEETLRAMQRAIELRIAPTPAQLEALSEKVDAAATPRGMTIAGSTAEIRVQGVLTKQRDFFAMWFGGGNTTYGDIISALGLAKSDPSIKDVVMVIDSPGGHADGLFDCLAAIEIFKSEKKMSVMASNAQSAAYAIAAMAGKIQATGPHATFGSIGTAMMFNFSNDITTVALTNTDSPDKRPDVTTPEGKAVVVKYLDAANDLFIDAIARGRGNGVTKQKVSNEYGRGASMFAADAKKRGMIDGIARPALRAVDGPSDDSIDASAEEGGATKDEPMTMDLRKLKADHHEVYEAASSEGAKKERDRVNAHLKMGAMGGEKGMHIAMKAIESGEDLTMSMTADYMVAQADNKAVRSRQEESNEAAQATASTAPTASAPAKDIGDEVADRIEAQLGTKSKAA